MPTSGCRNCVLSVRRRRTSICHVLKPRGSRRGPGWASLCLPSCCRHAAAQPSFVFFVAVPVRPHLVVLVGEVNGRGVHSFSSRLLRFLYVIRSVTRCCRHVMYVAGPCTLSQLTTLQALGSVPAQIAAVQAMASNPATFQCHACLVPCFSAGNPKQCAMGCMSPQVAATTARNRRDVAGTPAAARTFAATFMPQSAQPIRLELSNASAAVTSLGAVLLAAIAWCCL